MVEVTPSSMRATGEPRWHPPARTTPQKYFTVRPQENYDPQATSTTSFAGQSPGKVDAHSRPAAHLVGDFVMKRFQAQRAGGPLPEPSVHQFLVSLSQREAKCGHLVSRKASCSDMRTVAADRTGNAGLNAGMPAKDAEKDLGLRPFMNNTAGNQQQQLPAGNSSQPSNSVLLLRLQQLEQALGEQRDKQECDKREHAKEIARLAVAVRVKGQQLEAQLRDNRKLEEQLKAMGETVQNKLTQLDNCQRAHANQIETIAETIRQLKTKAAEAGGKLDKLKSDSEKCWTAAGKALFLAEAAEEKLTGLQRSRETIQAQPRKFCLSLSRQRLMCSVERRSPSRQHLLRSMGVVAPLSQWTVREHRRERTTECHRVTAIARREAASADILHRSSFPDTVQLRLGIPTTARGTKGMATDPGREKDTLVTDRDHPYCKEDVQGEGL